MEEVNFSFLYSVPDVSSNVSKDDKTLGALYLPVVFLVSFSFLVQLACVAQPPSDLCDTKHTVGQLFAGETQADNDIFIFII